MQSVNQIIIQNFMFDFHFVYIVIVLFPFQSSKYSSKRDYEREASNRSSYLRGNDRDLSPNSNVPSGTMNGSSYRMDSPDLDSSRDRDRSDRYQSSSYIQKFKDRGRNDYKKDKYLDKRDRREEHRTNHDRIDASSSSRRSSKMSKYSLFLRPIPF